MQAEPEVAFNLLVAALIGLAVGSEREISGHTTGPDGRFAGIRTFALLAGMGGIAGWLFRAQLPIAAAALLVTTLVFPVAAYVMAMRRPHTSNDATTEVAALLVVTFGLLAGLGFRVIAAGAASIVLLLLSEKTRFQGWLRRIDPSEMRAALHFAVLSLVVLPLLPAGGYGPFDAFRPRQLWFVVLLFSGLNFLGYIARRVVGETRGLAVTGLLGGLVSSTAVALNFSRRSRGEPALALPLALGVVAACTVLLPRVFVIASVLEPALSVPLMPFLLPPFAAGVTTVAIALLAERSKRSRSKDAANAPSMTVNTISAADIRPQNGADAGTTNAGLGNPLGLWSSIQMAVAFQAVLFLVAWLQTSVGRTGVLATAAMLGLTDMDALTVSMTRLASEPDQVGVAALAISIGILSNTALKSGLVLAFGGERYRLRAMIGLGALAVASGVGILIGSR